MAPSDATSGLSRPTASAAGQRLTFGLLIVLLALKAFAWGASGSVAVMASVIDTVLAIVAAASAMLVGRWAQRRAVPDEQGRRAQAGVTLVQVGLAVAGAAWIGAFGLRQILDPHAVGGGRLALIAMGLALGLVITGVALRQNAQPRPSILADPAPTFIAWLGMASASWLSAPGLDGAAALILAVWLGWGAVSQVRPALVALLSTSGSDALASAAEPPLRADQPAADADRSSVPYT